MCFSDPQYVEAAYILYQSKFIDFITTQATDIKMTNTNIFWSSIELVRHIIQIIGVSQQFTGQISDYQNGT